MIYQATHRDRTRKLRVEAGEPGFFKVSLEGRELLVDCLEPQPNLLSLLIEGRSYEVDVDPLGDGRWRVEIGGDRFDVAVADDRRARLAARQGHKALGGQDIRSPMAGHVRRVLVALGDRVEAGQVLLILEAMKMQNQISSAAPGVVAALAAREGATVAQGDPLCRVEPLPQEHP
jgi:oxaloacetate decarboxylase alpha subunit